MDANQNEDLTSGDIQTLQLHLTETRSQTITSVSESTSLLPPLAEIVADYATINPKIANVLHKLNQQMISDESYKLVWRVKHRNNPFGLDVAEISIERCSNILDRIHRENILHHMTIRMTRLDRHNGETMRTYLFRIDTQKLCRIIPESDGVTIRLNECKAVFSMEVFDDMYAIALTKLYSLIDK